MPDLVVSSTVDAFMSAADATAARAAIVAAADPAVRQVMFETFLAASPWPNVGLIGASSGGTSNVAAEDGQQSVLVLATGATASANQRGGMQQAAASIHFGQGTSLRTIFRARRGATPFDGTLTGSMVAGFHDALNGNTQDATDGCYFRSLNGANWFAVTRNNSVSTGTETDTGIACDTTWRSFDIDVNAAGTSVVYRIDGVTVATHSTNIPTGAGRQTGLGARCLRVAATGTAVELRFTWLALVLERSAALWT